jgi:hypothetical protein
MNQSNDTSYSKFKENERLAARNDWQRFVTTDARLADNLKTIARRAGYEAIYIYDTDPDRADAETVCVGCTSEKLDELVATATASTRRLACWGNMGQAPQNLRAFLRHFSEWLWTRWANRHEVALRSTIASLRGDTLPDLSNQRTLTYWMEYISEYSERAQVWTKFESATATA